MTKTTMIRDHSDVVVFPPVIPVSGFLLGVLVGRLAPPLLSSSAGFVRYLAGLLLFVGAAGFASMVVTMKRAHTPIHNAKTPTALVESGPFRWTRNPMYLFGTIGYVGLALLVEPWALATLPAVMLALHYGVVRREEAYLERKFGAAYARYRARVRRWI